ncbi:MAG: hypothetical protein M0T83_07660, partial [Nitrospiraceae bacterium]|nr:hypothetical protein [Nitrospiraceae bacterium]
MIKACIDKAKKALKTWENVIDEKRNDIMTNILIDIYSYHLIHKNINNNILYYIFLWILIAFIIDYIFYFIH